jgi:ribosomal protein S18 acetylase RimI-like enzyme
MHTVRVSKEHRRRGVASQLIKKALHLSKLQLIEIMTVWVDGTNTPAINLYHAMRFNEYGRLCKGIKRNIQYSEYVLLKKVLK